MLNFDLILIAFDNRAHVYALASYTSFASHHTLHVSELNEYRSCHEGSTCWQLMCFKLDAVKPPPIYKEAKSEAEELTCKGEGTPAVLC
jgi:hypothetical protein